MTTIYGIKNCDTIRKTLKWLKENEVEHAFHDYKKEGISEDKIQEWQQQVPWETLINKRGTTWRKLTEEEKEALDNPKTAMEWMMKENSMIKRPVIEADGKVVVGYDEAFLESLKE